MAWYYYIPIFVTGASLGSFLNACVWRVREKMSIWRGRSMCAHCRKAIKWFDNIPVVSFSFLRARCRSCKKKIGWHYPLVEIWMGIAFVFVAWFYYPTADHWSLITLHWFVVWVLTTIFLYDLKYQEILDRFTLIPAGILLIASIVFRSSNLSIFPSVPSMVLGIVIGSGFFLAQYLVSKGKWIGGGDIRLGVLMGVILGWKLTILALLLAYIIGAVIGMILLILAKRKASNQIAFGTFLTIATFVAMFWGERILKWYFGLIM